MAKSVLTAATTMTCAHAAPLTVVAPTKLTVTSTPVITHKSVKAAIIVCPAPIATGDVKCVSVANIAGKATKLTIDGDPVLLVGLAVTTTGNPSPVVVVPGVGLKLLAT